MDTQQKVIAKLEARRMELKAETAEVEFLLKAARKEKRRGADAEMMKKVREGIGKKPEEPGNSAT